MRRPFMVDPAQLSSLEGQQYLVLRPTGSVSLACREMQRAALALLDGDVPHPHTEHITLRGFAEPGRRDELLRFVRGWAAQQHPIDVIAEAVDSFPAPWQVLLLRLSRTPSLVEAYASLSAGLAGTSFRRLGELSLDDWVFHLSLVYGRALPPEPWTALEAATQRMLPGRPAETITQAEFVWYEGGIEHSEVIPLGIQP